MIMDSTTWLYDMEPMARQRSSSWGSTSQPWYRPMLTRSNTMHSGVYSKSFTDVNLTQSRFKKGNDR